MDDYTFRKAMGKFTTGVTVVTTVVDDEVYGMTANAFMSVSLNPKLILISIDEKANMNRYVKKTNKFAVSILNEQQQGLSAYFAGQVKEKRDIKFDWFNQMPSIQGALVTLACEVYDSKVAGDHTLFIGKVEALRVSKGNPLAFFDGSYKQVQKMTLKT